MLMRQRDRGPQVIGLLDIGSSKVCCVIVERTFSGKETWPSEMRVLGIGHQQSHGIKAGFVTDMDQAGMVVRNAVSQAERMAGLTLDDVVVSISCGRMKSLHFLAHADLEAGYVRPEDQRRLSESAYRFAADGGRAVVHMNRIDYLLDGSESVQNPLRMAGRKISVQYHAVTVDEAPLENLLWLIEQRSYLKVRQFVPMGLASALAATTDDERRFGIIVIDVGGGTANIAMIADGRFLYTDTLPFGGAHLTYDIARVLSTPLAEAERIKTLYGTLVEARSDEQDPVSYELAGEGVRDQYQTSKAELRRILYPRVHSQLMALRERIDGTEVLRSTDYNVVLTGGAVQLVGFAPLAADVLGRPVRIGRARATQSMPEALASPEFATVVGMIGGAANGRPQVTSRQREDQPSADTYLDRMKSWIRESF